MSGEPVRVSDSPRAWAGRAFIGIGRALYLGPAADTTPHAHHAIQLCCSLEGAFRLRSGCAGRWSEEEAALIPAGHPHQLDGWGRPALLLYLEPETLDAREILAGDPGEGVRRFAPAQRERLRRVVRGAALDDLGPAGASELYDEVLACVGIPGHRVEKLDERIVAALQRMRDPAWPRGSLTALARELGLSPSRFRHLFSGQLRISARRYVLWLRLVRSIEAATRGASVTDAALAAGFSDTAHLSRTFRRMLGITPSSVLGAVAVMPARGDPVAHPSSGSR